MKKIIFSVIFLGVFFTLSAQNWVVTETKGSQYIIESSDSKKTIVYSNTILSDALLQKIGNCLNAAWAIPGIEGSSASLKVESESVFRFVLYPDSFSYKNNDFNALLPSGLGFYYNSALFYDITMMVGDLMPKVAGAYASPDDLLSEMHSASIMPDMYMYDTYFLKRLERLEKALMAESKRNIFGKTSEVSEDIVLTIKSMYNENPSITKREVAEKLKQKNIKATTADINAVFMVYLGIIE